MMVLKSQNTSNFSYSHLISSPCRIVTFKELCVLGIDCSKVVDIREENCRLDHIIKSTVGRLKDEAHVCQRLLGLWHHPSLDHLHGLRDETNLTRDIEGVVDLSMVMVTVSSSCVTTLRIPELPGCRGL